MSGKQISVIYFYLVSAASLALIVVGVFSVVNFVINLTQYDKYPVRYFQEDCDADPYRYAPKGPYPAEIAQVATPSAEEREKQKSLCRQRVEDERKKTKIEDLKNAITFTLVGSILFLIHFPQARKQSKA